MIMMKKGTIKEFLKPDWRKIIVFVFCSLILFSITFNGCSVLKFFIPNYFCIEFISPIYQGFPLPIYSISQITDIKRLTTNWVFNLIYDIIWWYIDACLIVWIYDKIKRKITKNNIAK